MKIELSEKEYSLIRYLREVKHGRLINVFVQDSQPIRIEEVYKSIKL